MTSVPSWSKNLGELFIFSNPGRERTYITKSMSYFKA
jgi:hypothetical protein